MEVCCGFFGFDAGDAIEEEAEENPFHAPQAHKPKQKHVARHKATHKKKKHHRVIPKHHHAARASTVAKGNGTRDHCALPKPTGVAWDGLTAMMPITDPQWEKDFMERLDRIESSDLLRPSATDGSTVLMFACEHRDALAMSLILHPLTLVTRPIGVHEQALAMDVPLLELSCVPRSALVCDFPEAVG